MQRSHPLAVRDATGTYNKLVKTLVPRAIRMGSRDAESAAQETLKRSFENVISREAIEYYLQDDAPAGSTKQPEWTLLQLLAWLHGVLRRVVLEELAQSSYRREVAAGDARTTEVRDPSSDQLEALVTNETRMLIHECQSSLRDDYRAVLALRYSEGLTYSQIAARLELNQNTVATRLSRATQALAYLVCERIRGVQHTPKRRRNRE